MLKYMVYGASTSRNLEARGTWRLLTIGLVTILVLLG